MAFPVYMRASYESRYALLGAMADELSAAFAAKGCPINPDEPIGTRPGAYLWFNFPNAIEAIPPEARDPKSGVALIQIFVDHPYAMHETLTDALVSLPHYRLLMPCVDGQHLMRARWPGLRVHYMAHAIGPESICERVDDDRPAGIVVAGSIHAEHELVEAESQLPAEFRRPCREMAALMTVHPWMPYEQAADLAMGARSMETLPWKIAAGLWRITAARVNRQRRTALVSALQGLPVEVWGLDPWREFCTGTIEYKGEFAYADSGAVLARGKACLAWGPTQFQHSYSERQLLSMAAGCATVSDDRLLVRGQLATGLEVFDASRPTDAAELFRDLLSDEPRRLDLATRGRALVEGAHLWSHRVERIASIASDAIVSARAGNPAHAA